MGFLILNTRFCYYLTIENIIGLNVDYYVSNENGLFINEEFENIYLTVKFDNRVSKFNLNSVLNNLIEFVDESLNNDIINNIIIFLVC